MTKEQTLTALKEKLRDWQAVPELQLAFRWRADTVRGRVSDLKRSGTEIERKRENGITSYRVAQ